MSCYCPEQRRTKAKHKRAIQCHILILCHHGVGSGPRSTSFSPSFSRFHHDLRLSRHALWLATRFYFTSRGSGSRCSHQFDRCMLCRTVYSGFYEHHQCVVVVAYPVLRTDVGLRQSALYYLHLMYLPTYFSFLDSTRRPRIHNSFTNFLRLLRLRRLPHRVLIFLLFRSHSTLRCNLALLFIPRLSIPGRPNLRPSPIAPFLPMRLSLSRQARSQCLPTFGPRSQLAAQAASFSGTLFLMSPSSLA